MPLDRTATLLTGVGAGFLVRDEAALLRLAGVNAVIIGNYLTTLGRAPQDDLRMLADLGMPVKRGSDAT